MELGEVCRIPRPHEGLPGPLSPGKKVFSPSGETRGRAGDRTGCVLPAAVMSRDLQNAPHPHPVPLVLIICISGPARCLEETNTHQRPQAQSSFRVQRQVEMSLKTRRVQEGTRGPALHGECCPETGIRKSTRVPDRTLRTPCGRKAPGTKAPLGPSALS